MNKFGNISSTPIGITSSTPITMSKVLAKSGIIDGQNRQELTTNGSGAYSFQTPASKPIATVGVFRDGAQSIPKGNPTSVIWNGELWKSGITHSNTINPERLTVVTAGIYNISVEIPFYGLSAGNDTSLVWIYVNSPLSIDPRSGRRYGGQRRTGNASGSGDVTISTCATISLSVGDWISVVVFHLSSSNRNISTTSSTEVQWGLAELGMTLFAIL